MLTGWFDLLRLYARRDRIVLPLWVLLLSLPLGSVYVASIDKVYPSVAERASFVASVAASPAQRAMYGNIYNDSVGATALWKAGVYHALIGVAVILTVIRHTRADEEAGRAELLGSTAVGRYAGITAALSLAFGGSIATGLIGTAGLLTTNVPAAGSVAFGLALAGSGLVFSAVAAVAAQLTVNARTARGISFSVLGAAFALRAVGDAGGGALSWFSPLGWSLQVRPYAGERWWVLLLHLVATVALTVCAYALLGRRDIGAGLIPERAGPSAAGAALSGPLGLAWRLQRGSVVAWTAGLCLYALLAGSVVHGVGSQIGDSQTIRDILSRLGGTSAVESAFVAISFGFLGIAASAQAISSALRLHSEEAAGRAEPTLAGAVSRSRWAASHLLFAVGGPAVALMAAGVVAGLTYGLAADDVGGRLPGVLSAAAVQLPFVWLSAGIALCLFGIVPRFTQMVWGFFIAFVALYFLGSVAGMPQWVLDVSPFSHVPRVPGEALHPSPVIWALVVDLALLTLGLLGLHRRDIR